MKKRCARNPDCMTEEIPQRAVTPISDIQSEILIEDNSQNGGRKSAVGKIVHRPGKYFSRIIAFEYQILGSSLYHVGKNSVYHSQALTLSFQHSTPCHSRRILAGIQRLLTIISLLLQNYIISHG